MNWNQFWSDAVSTVIGAGIGAWLAFKLERDRREAELHRQEVGQCHVLICLLKNRLNVLQDFHEYLFANFEREHGRAPRWDEVPALDGAPERTEEISIGDYTFLLDGREHESNAPALLSKAQLSTINTNSAFALIARRNALWHQREDARGPLMMPRGEDAVPVVGRIMALERSLSELTEWIHSNLQEEIATLHSIFDLLYEVMRDRFPKEKLLHFRPLGGGAPLGHASHPAAPPPQLNN